jgi:hypothetical protein
MCWDPHHWNCMLQHPFQFLVLAPFQKNLPQELVIIFVFLVFYLQSLDSWHSDCVTCWMVCSLNPTKDWRFFSSLFRTFRPALGPLGHLVSGYWGSFLGVKRPGHDAHHSPSSSVQVKNEWSYTSSSPICFHVVDRDNSSFICFSYFLKWS